jgi:hypothetical protein
MPGCSRFSARNSLVVQATASTDGAPQAAVVGYAVTDDLELVFDTLASTRKAENFAPIHGWLLSSAA